MRIRVLLASLILLTLSASLPAQPLIDRIPGDAVFYVGWNGSDSMGPEFEASHFKAVLDATDAPKLFNEFIPKVFAKIGEKDRDAKKASDLFGAIVTPMWKYPTAIYVAKMDWPDAGPPMPKMVVLCNAGAQSAALADKVKAALAEAGDEPPVPVTVSDEGGVVSLVIGKASTDAGKLADTASFKAAIAKVHGKPVAIAYLDGEALINQINLAVEKGNDRKAKREWPKARQLLGIDGFKSGIWTAAFEDKNWSTRAFIAAPAPRAGVLKFLDSQPLPADTMKIVPGTAIMAAAGRFDLGKAYDAIVDLVAAADPRAKEKFDREMKKANDEIGMDLRKDFLGSLGDTWVYYVDPMTGGNSLLGGVLLNKLPDPAKAEQTFTKMENDFNKFAVEKGRGEITIAYKRAKLDGLDVHYLAIPIITPAWTIKDGYLVAGLYPQTAVAAAKNLSAGKSLAEAPGYVELRKKLGDTPSSTINYMDLPKLAPQGYATWLLISRVAGIGDMLGVDSPIMILPPMYKLQEHLSASGSATWSTDEGFHFRAVSPFPGSNLIASDPMSMVGVLQPMFLIGAAGAGMSDLMAERPNLAPPQLYYTTDDAKTWFAGPADRIPPFAHAGKQAVRVYVFKCGENGKNFAAYLERYTPEAAKKMQKLATTGIDDPMEIEQIQVTGVEVKRPGDAKWVNRNSPEGEKVINDIKCPDGTQNNLEPVSPND